MFQLKGRNFLNCLSTMSVTFDHITSTFDTSNFEGQDVSLEISLKEYGVCWELLGSKIRFWFGIRWNGKLGEFTEFDHCFFDSDLDVFDYFNWADFPAVYRYTGLSEEDWKKLPLPLKITDLYGYYGTADIFGSYRYA